MNIDILAPLFNKFRAQDFALLDSPPKGRSKEEKQKALLQRFGDDQAALQEFLQLYRRLELGGRKHFFIWRHTFTAGDIERLRAFTGQLSHRNDLDVLAELREREDRVVLDSNKYGDVIQFRGCKYIREQIKTEEGQNSTEEVVTYRRIPLHHIAFMNFMVDRNVIVVGIDTHTRLLSGKKEIYDYAQDLYMRVLGEPVLHENLVCAEDMETIARRGNVLVIEAKTNTDVNYGTRYNIRRRTLTSIIAAVKNGDYGVDDVRPNNVTADLSYHPVFQRSTNMGLEGEHEVVTEWLELYWFCNKDRVSCLHCDLDSVQSSLVTYSSAVFDEEAYDVIECCINS